MKQKVNFPFKMLFSLDLGVNKIAARAFISNLKVVEIDFNNVITEIGSQAFWNCRNLSTIDLTGVVTIGSQAFATCDEALTDIYIPSSVRRIGEYIGLRAFSYQAYAGIEELILPDSLKTIEENAFSGYQNLKTIKLPANLTYLGGYAFSSAEALTTITFTSKKMTYIGGRIIDDTSVYYQTASNWDNNGLYLGNYLIAVKNSSAVTSFTLKNDTLGIAAEAGTPTFREDPYLKNIDLTSPSLTFIGEEAFASQTYLTNVNINCPNIVEIGLDFLNDAPYLTSQDYVVSNGLLLKVNVDSTSITLPADVKILAPGSIASNVEVVNNSANVTKVLAKVFSNSALREFTFGPNLEYIGQLAFSFTKLNLTVLDLTSVKYIADNAFNQAKTIKTIVLDEAADYMENRLFGYATASDHQIFIKGDKINSNCNQDFNKADGGVVPTYFYSETNKPNTWHYENGVAKLW